MLDRPQLAENIVITLIYTYHLLIQYMNNASWDWTALCVHGTLVAAAILSCLHSLKSKDKVSLSSVGTMVPPLFLMSTTGITSSWSVASCFLSLFTAFNSHIQYTIDMLFFKRIVDIQLLLIGALFIVPTNPITTTVEVVLFASFFCVVEFYLNCHCSASFSPNELMITCHLLAYTMASSVTALKSGSALQDSDYVIKYCTFGLGFIFFTYLGLMFTYTSAGIVHPVYSLWRIVIVFIVVSWIGKLFITPFFWKVIVGTILKHSIVFTYWLMIGASFAALLFLWRIQPTTSNTAVRKLFHLLAILLFLPPIVTDAALMRFAFGVAILLFLFVEFVRYIGQVAPLGKWHSQITKYLTDAMRKVLNSKDLRGPIVYSHTALLVGCALPLISCENCANNARVVDQILFYACGTLFLGFGDSAASVIGSRYGKLHWTRHTKKTVEGSIAAFIATLGGATAFVLMATYFQNISNIEILQAPFKVAITSLLACLLEAANDDLDNLVIPPVLVALQAAQVNAHVPSITRLLFNN